MDDRVLGLRSASDVVNREVRHRLNGHALRRDVHDALSTLEPRHDLLRLFFRGARLSL